MVKKQKRTFEHVENIHTKIKKRTNKQKKKQKQRDRWKYSLAAEMVMKSEGGLKH